MHNNFTNKLTELQNFNLEPSAQVWQEIEKDLQQKKKRRIVAWWWSVPVLCVAFAIFTLTKNNKHQQILAYNINSNNATTVIEKNKDNFSKEANSFSKTSNHSNLITQTVNKTPKSFIKNIQNFSRNAPKFDKNAQAFYKNIQSIVKNTQSFSSNTQNLDKNTESFVKNSQTFDKNTQNLDKNAQSFDKILPTTSSSTEIKNKKLALTVDSAIVNTKNMTSQKASTKKLSYSINCSAGANYCSKNGLFQNNNTSSNYLSSASLSTTVIPSADSIFTLTLPQTGFHFALGINANMQLSKKINLQTGLLYRYIQNTIGLQNNSSIPTYTAGTKMQYKNYSHQFEVPVNFSYCLTSNKANKLSLIGGVNLAYIFKDNWLKINDSKFEFFEPQQQQNRLLLGLQMGVGYTFKNNTNINFMARKYVTPVTNNSVKYYWQQVEMQINIPFNIFKK